MRDRSRRQLAARRRRCSRRTARSLCLVFALVFAPATTRQACAACVEFGSPPTISTVALGATAVATADLDGDGDLDVLSASFDDSTIAWYANDSTPADGGWIMRTISIAASGPYSVAAGDVDGDGDLDVLSASLNDDLIAWYANDGTPADGGWIARTISIAADGAYSVHAADVDGDSDLDVLSASALDNEVAWYENDGTPGDGGWIARTISAAELGARSVFAADVDGDGDADAISASLIDNTIAWHENDGTPADGGWIRRAISTTAAGAFSVVASDVDGDGDLDALSASTLDDKIAWHENDGTPANGGWVTHTISTAAAGTFSAVAADLDGDGDLDALSASGNDDTIAWYRNERLHDTALFAPAATLSTASGSFFSVAAADLDRDGDLDAVSTSYFNGTIALHRNLPPGDGSSWTAVAISTLIASPYSVSTADLDGDGDVDVLSSHYGIGFRWFENTAGDATTFSPITVHASAGGAYTPVAADLDRDGDLDIAAARGSNDRVDWFENLALDGDGSLWTLHTIAIGVGYAIAVDLADLDGDGDLDAVSAAASGDAILWHKNLSGDGETWTTQTIATVNSPRDAAAADLDGDGDLDALMASDYEDRVAWYENLAGDGSTWSEHAIATGVPNTETAVPADVDGDGDLDVLATALYGSTPVWFENDGSPAVGAWIGHPVSTTAPGGADLYVADVDGDGDLDVLSASSPSGQIRWHPNLGTGVFDDGFDSDANKACWSSSTP